MKPVDIVDMEVFANDVISGPHSKNYSIILKPDDLTKFMLFLHKQYDRAVGNVGIRYVFKDTPETSFYILDFSIWGEYAGS